MNYNDKVREITTGAEMSRSAFNVLGKCYDTTVTDAEGRERVLGAIDYLTQVKGRVPVHADQYEPNQPIIFQDQGLTFVNSFRENTIPRVPDNWQESQAPARIKDHLLTMFNDSAHGTKLIQWMAYNVQHMGKKIMWAPIICGIQGDGKSTIFNILTAVLGEQNTKDISTQELFSDFSGYAEGACVCALEEIRVRGKNRHEVMNTLKPLITNKRISVVKKGSNAKNVKNTINYIGFTNYPDALVLEEDDRRWAVFFSKFEDKETLWAERSRGYWENLYEAIENEAGAIRGWLLSVDLTGFDPLSLPDTGDFKARMVEAARSDDEKHMVEIINGSAEPRSIATCQALRQEARLDSLHISNEAIGRLLKSLGWTQYQRTRVRGTITRIYLHPLFVERFKKGEVDHAKIVSMAEKIVDSTF